ncbi:glycosyltransferase [Microcella putealis]|uniref:glycosyltransferase n=1 Tax=Microcella putealis TaxID=337005 RepID=UPI001F53FECE
MNFRGVDDTIAAIESLRQSDWPSELLHIVVVENGSGDDSVERLRDVDGITLVVSDKNLGFAGGCNLGVRETTADIVAFLNNDARPDSGWIRHAIDAFSSAPDVAAVASKVLDWDGTRIDYAGSALTWYGMGYKPFTAEPISLSDDTPRDVLFGTGSAMFVRRDIFAELGGFDERFFMFFEDVDLGWRLNLRGYRMRYEPRSIAFHKHHASMADQGRHKEQVLLERNALYAMFKNLDPDTLADALAPALALSVRRALVESKLDPHQFDLQRNDGPDATIEVPKSALVPLFAIDQFIDALPDLQKRREAVQASRRRSDGAIWALFGKADAPVVQDKRYLEGYEAIVGAFSVTERPRTRRVVVVTGDPLGDKIAGPAIRAWNIASALHANSEVELVSLTAVSDRLSAPFAVTHIRPGDERSMERTIRAASAIIFQGHALAAFECIRRSPARIVADIYDPMQLEQLEQARDAGTALWEHSVVEATTVMNDQLERADFFICASERQRHFYLGQLSALGRLTTAQYGADADLRGLIDVVPFGLPETPPSHERSVVKGVIPGIPADAKLLLWSGGLYNWFDPLTLIRAVAALRAKHPDVHLFFQGTKHPHPGVPEMRVVTEARALAAELGVLGQGVHFNDSWVDYSERGSYLREADAGVSTHHVHVETTFSFRTRILDYLWGELPMVVTKGDYFADLVEQEGLGVVVDDSDVDGLRNALETVLFDEGFRDSARVAIRRVKQRFTWSEVLRPLVSYIESEDQRTEDRGSARRPERRRASGLRHDAALAFRVLRAAGPAAVVRKVAGRIQRRFH